MPRQRSRGTGCGRWPTTSRIASTSWCITSAPSPGKPGATVVASDQRADTRAEGSCHGRELKVRHDEHLQHEL